MRRLVLGLAIVASASKAASADPCSVTIVRAPDEVRAAIDHWVAAEPRCARALEVRVVPTDSGLYVLAQSADQTYERMVPDAQTAAVLVTSWAADDGTARGASSPRAARPSDIPVAAVEPIDVSPPASVLPTPEAYVDAGPARGSPGLVSFAPMVDLSGMVGIGTPGVAVRLGLDLVNLFGLRLGAVVSHGTMDWSETKVTITGDNAVDSESTGGVTTESRIAARAAIEHTWGHVVARAEFSLGYVEIGDASASSGFVPQYEVAASVGSWLNRDWRLRSGAIFQTMPDVMSLPNSGPALRAFIGIDRRL